MPDGAGAVPAISRRHFLVTGAAAGGGLLVGIGVPACVPASAHTHDQLYRLTAWVSVGTDGTVSILCGSQDMGQGIYSALAQIVGEELRVDWSTVVVGPAPLNNVYDNPVYRAQITAGSASVRGYFDKLLKAGAIARQMLIEAAAAFLKVPAGSCTAVNGMVVVTGTGRSVPFGMVAEAAAMLKPPKNAELYSKDGFVLVGQPVPRPDIPAKVTGATVYGLDVVVPGMVYGAVRLCPTRGGTTGKIGKPPYQAQLVDLGVGIAAVMDPGPNCTTWAAIQAANQAKVQWNLPANAAEQTSKTILQIAEMLLADGTGVVAETHGNAAAAQAKAAHVLTFSYILPYLPHTTMEPPNCTASVTSNACEIWAATQDPGGAQATAMAITGLPAKAVTVNCVPMGGGLGRKLEQDFVAYAVMASKQVGLPVQMVFSREQDFSQDQYRPMSVCGVTIGLNEAGAIVSWIYRNVSPSILYQRGLIGMGQLDTQASEGSTGLPYRLPNVLVDWVQHSATIPVGYWRSVGHSINTFAVESAIDEAAAFSKTDPLLFRQKLLAGQPRVLAVLNAAASLGGWGGQQPPNTAQGIACHELFGSIVAMVVQITQTNGTIQLLNVACAVDCGKVINPNTAAQQIEGGIVQGLTAALWGQIQFSKGVAQTLNFNFYRMMRMADMPTVQVTLLQTEGAPIGGLGEVGVPCVAPALASAWAALTQQRLRSLPLFPVKY